MTWETKPQPEGVPINEMKIRQASAAIAAEQSSIRCPNGCYEPYEVAHHTIRAAMRLPQCEKCGSYHLVAWGDGADADTDTNTDTDTTEDAH